MQPLQQGWLFKKSGGKDGVTLGNLQDKWNRRWFSLDRAGTLSYYKHEEDATSSTPAGSLDCRGGALGRFDSDIDEHVFTIKTRGRLLTMRASSDDVLASWAEGDPVACTHDASPLHYCSHQVPCGCSTGSGRCA